MSADPWRENTSVTDRRYNSITEIASPFRVPEFNREPRGTREPGISEIPFAYLVYFAVHLLSGANAAAFQTLARWPGVVELRQSSWTAPAEHRGDGAFAWPEPLRIDARLTQSGVALRLPPHSKTHSFQLNPKGIPSFSPGLVRAGLARSYPG